MTTPLIIKRVVGDPPDDEHWFYVLEESTHLVVAAYRSRDDAESYIHKQQFGQTLDVSGNVD